MADQGRGCRHCEADGAVLQGSLDPIRHEASVVDYDEDDYRRGGHQVWRCRMCGAFWGQEWNWDLATAHEEHWSYFGRDPAAVRRYHGQGA